MQNLNFGSTTPQHVIEDLYFDLTHKAEADNQPVAYSQNLITTREGKTLYVEVWFTPADYGFAVGPIIEDCTSIQRNATTFEQAANLLDLYMGG